MTSSSSSAESEEYLEVLQPGPWMYSCLWCTRPCTLTKWPGPLVRHMLKGHVWAKERRWTCPHCGTWSREKRLWDKQRHIRNKCRGGSTEEDLYLRTLEEEDALGVLLTGYRVPPAEYLRHREKAAEEWRRRTGSLPPPAPDLSSFLTPSSQDQEDAGPSGLQPQPDGGPIKLEPYRATSDEDSSDLIEVVVVSSEPQVVTSEEEDPPPRSRSRSPPVTRSRKGKGRGKRSK